MIRKCLRNLRQCLDVPYLSFALGNPVTYFIKFNRFYLSNGSLKDRGF